MVGIAIATEDELSEAVARRLVAEVQPALEVSQTLRRNGFGYLRSRMSNWCELARFQPILLLTDLDRVACPVELLRQWRGTLVLPDDLLLRIAVREVEAWLLADQPAMRVLLGERGRLPVEPDALPDPKATLLQLAARHASRDVRADLVQQSGAMASQGIGYNARLVQWVQDHWEPARAADSSPSLRRARIRLQDLAVRVTQ
ncbi:hypothetical protein [Sphaerotilus sp.]|uniref:hypothetical protein n=1 Tax=Sphaerotilus sp. TaxID=2093942 RepID=UPI002ACEB152|nr:hypothetical protein [Sphaerotilus sp.]MDZ7856187.1 hypothetical protein [Sphaerotilus sp.]